MKNIIFDFLFNYYSKKLRKFLKIYFLIIINFYKILFFLFYKNLFYVFNKVKDEIKEKKNQMLIIHFKNK